MSTLIDKDGNRVAFQTIIALDASLELDGNRFMPGGWSDYTFEDFTPPGTTRKINKRSFQNRFPAMPDGISTKYDAMTMFLNKDSYAEALIADATQRLGLQMLITTGLNRVESAGYVDLDDVQTQGLTALLAQPTVPDAFRLTSDERTAILTAPVTAAEAWEG